jgi:hypothetical protein
LEAAIGIEPMNKGFANHLGLCALSVTEYHGLIIINFLGLRSRSVSLHVAPWSLQFPLHGFIRRGGEPERVLVVLTYPVRRHWASLVTRLNRDGGLAENLLLAVWTSKATLCGRSLTVTSSEETNVPFAFPTEG